MKFSLFSTPKHNCSAKVKIKRSHIKKSVNKKKNSNQIIEYDWLIESLEIITFQKQFMVKDLPEAWTLFSFVSKYLH